VVDLKELSRRLGLSMTTVSRALNGYPEVSARTRARVVELASELGYTPNALARRLSSGRAECIGFVLEEADAYFGDPYFSQLIAGIGTCLSRANFDLVISCASSRDDQLPAYRRLVDGRRVDGLILDRTRTVDGRVAYLLTQGVPFVTLGRNSQQDRHSWIDVDGEAAFHALTSRLVGLGHRRVGFIGADPAYNFVRVRHAGYCRALLEAGIEPDPGLRVDADLTEAGGAGAAATLLARPIRPTALVCIDDLTALGALRQARAKGLAIGRDVSVTGYNDVVLAGAADPRLTTIRVPIRAAGERLASMLLERLRSPLAETVGELWTGTLILGGSDGPCTAAQGVRP
jgi:LacI family transcriptional regulator